VQGVDFVLKGVLVVKTKAYGSPKGPNRYFSETLTRRANAAFLLIAQKLEQISHQPAVT